VLLSSLAHRDRQDELMDRPDIDPAVHQRALRGLARINRFSGSARIVWRPLAEFARSQSRPIHVLDIATGAGDLPIALAKRAIRANLPIRFTGCDISATAVTHAQNQSASEGGLTFIQRDVLRDGIPDGVDVVTCSLFLHHLEDAEALTLFGHVAQSSARLLIVNDLARSRTGFLLASIGTRLLSRSPVVHIDGPRSVRAAYTPLEAVALTERAGLHGASVVRRWPCRFLLSWKR